MLTLVGYTSKLARLKHGIGDHDGLLTNDRDLLCRLKMGLCGILLGSVPVFG